MNDVESDTSDQSFLVFQNFQNLAFSYFNSQLFVKHVVEEAEGRMSRRPWSAVVRVLAGNSWTQATEARQLLQIPLDTTK